MYFLTTVCCLGQTFEVASVKQNMEYVETGKVARKGGTFNADGATMSLVILWAYNLQTYQLVGPEWIFWSQSNTMPRYDIRAKFDPMTSDEEVRKMLQNLLQERMGLKTHNESRVMNAYSVRSEPSGLKIEYTAENDDSSPLLTRTIVRPGEMKLIIRNSTMREVCNDVSMTVHTPLVDETGIGNRRFSATIALHFDPTRREDFPNSLLESLKQLGVVITKAKLPIEVIVVDSISRLPTEN